jgi:hypothetical protein
MEPHCCHRFPGANGETNRPKLKLVPFVRATPKRWADFAEFLADLPGDLRERMEAWLKEREYDVPRVAKKKGKKA